MSQPAMCCWPDSDTFRVAARPASDRELGAVQLCVEAARRDQLGLEPQKP